MAGKLTRFQERNFNKSMSEVLDWPIEYINKLRSNFGFFVWLIWTNSILDFCFASYDCNGWLSELIWLNLLPETAINQNGRLKFLRYEKQMINGCCGSCDCTLQPWQDFGLKWECCDTKPCAWRHLIVGLAGGSWCKVPCFQWCFLYHWLEEMIQFYLFVFLKCDDNHQLCAGCLLLA